MGDCRPGGTVAGGYKAAGMVSAAVALAVALALAGCASYTNAVEFNRVYAEEAGAGIPGRADQFLSPRQQAEVMRSFKSLAAGTTAVNPPAPAPHGVRWSEIPQALVWACNEDGVEMVIVQTNQDLDGYEFILRTIEDWPAKLVIGHGRGEQVYEITEVSVGRFPDNPDRVERGAALVKAFETWLRTMGAKRKLNDRPQEPGPATPRPAGPRQPGASS